MPLTSEARKKAVSMDVGRRQPALSSVLTDIPKSKSMVLIKPRELEWRVCLV